MKRKQQGTWVGDKDLSRDPEFLQESDKEFNQHLPIVDSFGDNRSLDVRSSRRDFLKYLGFGLGAATVAASCEIPIRKAIPYAIKPDTIVPGVATYYASSFVHGGDYCSILVKTREGRPIKIEGNDLSPVTYGGTTARAQAYVLSLYDTNRFKGPQKKAGDGWASADWDEVDNAVTSALTPDSQIRILTHTVLSPAAKRVTEEFSAAFPNTRVVTYDPVSSAAMLRANERDFGYKAIPNYHFDKAQVVVGIQADFLGTWINPVRYARDYVTQRKIKDAHNPEMSRHFQIESHMSLTGSNADNRVQVKPTQLGAAIKYLHNAVAAQTGGASAGSVDVPEKVSTALDKVATALVAHRGESLVVCGTNDTAQQTLVNAINNNLQNYGQTLDFDSTCLLRQGDESDVASLLSDMEDGRIDALFVHGANPVFELPNGEAFAQAMANVPLSVSFALLDDETTARCQFVAPVHHGLESWGDAEPYEGQFSLIQPTIAPLFDTRQAEESLLRWCESAQYNTEADQPYYEYLKWFWRTQVFPRSGKSDFVKFWDLCLHDGVFSAEVGQKPSAFAGDVNVAGQAVQSQSNGELEITFYEPVGIGAGQYSNNPWLMEMPDPVTRCAWDSYLSIPLTWDGVNRFVGLNDLEDGDLADIAIDGTTERVPVIKQFGQLHGTLAMPLGYGRSNAGRCGTDVGTDVQKWLSYNDEGLLQYYTSGASLTGKKGEDKEFACVQYHHTMGVKGVDKETQEEINADEAAAIYNTVFGLVKQGYQGGLVDRTIIRRAHIDDVETFVHDLEHEREHHQHLNAQSIYPDYSPQYENGHHWGMHVDLNACIGCGACTVACMAENNVPVVGRKEVSRHHEMTWLRIDRYYYGDVENPNVVYQPLMCQHCDNAPCENVCPVNATNHSTDGINQMIYNRCIGTRYCANNCPYKVRRFNWLDFTTADLWPVNERGIDHEADVPWAAENLTRMVLNPDVTVRARGVMEKCTFCVQRIQHGKVEAKTDGRALRDADVRTACQTACPTGAITFGDQNDKNGELSEKLESPLNYIVLEEVNTRSSVNYQAKISNKDESFES